jgi:large subunit ribosomal protein L17
MLSNMAVSLIKHKRIFTTLAKAKELRKYIEPLITKSKTDTTHSRRMVFRNLTNKFAVKELFQEISKKIGDRPGGYTRIIKTGNRLGDNASTCFIELVDYNELMLKDKTQAKAKTRRSRRGGTGKGTAKATTTVETPKTPVVPEPEAVVSEPKPEAVVPEKETKAKKTKVTKTTEETAAENLTEEIPAEDSTKETPPEPEEKQ